MIVLQAFIKLNFFLRLFKNMSSLITMIKDVFNDISFFLLYFMMIVIFISYSLFVLSSEDSYFDYYMIVFKLAIGDVDFEKYQEDGIEV